MENHLIFYINSLVLIFFGIVHLIFTNTVIVNLFIHHPFFTESNSPVLNKLNSIDTSFKYYSICKEIVQLEFHLKDKYIVIFK